MTDGVNCFLHVEEHYKTFLRALWIGCPFEQGLENRGIISTPVDLLESLLPRRRRANSFQASRDTFVI